MDDFDLALEKYKEAAKEVGRNFTKADDDWYPVLIIHSGAKEENDIFPLQMADDDDKMLLTRVIIPLLIKTSGAKFAALVLSFWASEHPMPDVIPERWDDLPFRPSEDPNRSEVLQIMAASADRTEIWTAKILRDDEHPPGLSEWEQYDQDQVSGLFIEALRKGFESG